MAGRARPATHPSRKDTVYPDQYPSVPPWIEPLDPSIRWTLHQYGEGGPLCLETRPDSWSDTWTGVDVLRSAHRLLVTENPLGEGPREVAPSAHHVGAVQAHSWGEYVIFVSEGCFDRIRHGNASGPRAMRWFAPGELLVMLVCDDNDAPELRPSTSMPGRRMHIGVVVVRAEPPPSEAPLADRAALASALGVDDDAWPGGNILVIVVGATEVVPFAVSGTQSVYRWRFGVLPDEHGKRSGRARSDSKKRVGIVGLGSVGSKVAEILVRSGVERFFLVDGDVFLPGNLARHALDWRDVGCRKVNGVKALLEEIVPGVEVLAIEANLNWQRSAKTHAWQVEELASCDVVIDATGHVPTALALGALAAANGLPFVSAEVFEGGLGALVARAVPGASPPYVRGRAAYHAFCDEKNVAVPARGPRNYEALSATGEIIVADDAAVSLAAAHAARVVLDIIDGATSDGSWLLLGFRAGWLFKHLGDNIVLDVGAASPPLPLEADATAQAFVHALAKEALDAAQAST